MTKLEKPLKVDGPPGVPHRSEVLPRRFGRGALREDLIVVLRDLKGPVEEAVVTADGRPIEGISLRQGHPPVGSEPPHGIIPPKEVDDREECPAGGESH
jgi:hypothetical protein